MSKIEVDKVDPQSGTALEIGTSGDTVTVPSGVGLTLTNSTLLLPTTINTDKLDPKSGTALEIGTSGDTITVPTGAGLTVTDEVKTNKISPATGTAFALGDSGDTFTVPSGATIDNLGTATGFGGGKLLQIISATYSSELSTTPSSFTDTGLAATITPALTSSKILILCTNSFSVASADYTYIGIERDISGGSATFLGNATYGLGVSLDNGGSGSYSMTMNYLDSPSTTSAITFSCQYKCSAAAVAQKAGSMAVMTLIEVGA